MAANQSFTFGALDLTLVVTDPPFLENCYIIRHRESGDAVVIDPGSAAARIQDAVTALDARPLEIWLTHGHPDHLGAVRTLQEAWSVPCRAQAPERPVIEAAPRLAAAFTGETMQGPSAVEFFSGEPALSAGAISARVIATPGHTPGGVCYAFDGFTVTGDTLFRGGVGRTDLPGGDQAALTASITRMLDGLADGDHLFAGHGPSWTVADAQQWWRWML